MKCLILYAHPNPKSFNNAILKTIENQLEKNGHQVEIRDLYKIEFDPVLKADDFEKLQQGQVTEDVKIEQDFVAWADLIIVVAPVWWANLPAILKGYIDRVFSHGFAYTFGENGPEGLLPGKQAYLVSTSGAPNEIYSQMGMHDSFTKTIDEGIFSFCGIQVIEHKYFGAVPMVSDEDRKAMLRDIESSIGKI